MPSEKVPVIDTSSGKRIGTRIVEQPGTEAAQKYAAKIEAMKAAPASDWRQIARETVAKLRQAADEIERILNAK